MGVEDRLSHQAHQAHVLLQAQGFRQDRQGERSALCGTALKSCSPEFLE